jgi:hypothetical protein
VGHGDAASRTPRGHEPLVRDTRDRSTASAVRCTPNSAVSSPIEISVFSLDQASEAVASHAARQAGIFGITVLQPYQFVRSMYE